MYFRILSLWNVEPRKFKISQPHLIGENEDNVRGLDAVLQSSASVLLSRLGLSDTKVYEP